MGPPIAHIWLALPLGGGGGGIHKDERTQPSTPCRWSEPPWLVGSSFSVPDRASLAMTPPLSSVSEGYHFLLCPLVTSQRAWDAPFHYVLDAPPPLGYRCVSRRPLAGQPPVHPCGSQGPRVVVVPFGAAVPDSAFRCCAHGRARAEAYGPPKRQSCPRLWGRASSGAWELESG